VGGGRGAVALSPYRTRVRFTRKPLELPTPETALPERDTPIEVRYDPRISAQAVFQSSSVLHVSSRIGSPQSALGVVQ
jgi:hypothetical protein